ncbi:MAG: 6-pyruvoyl tetrahydrobiopterin synthase [Candidatus Hydrogenedentes bacterium CG07_land_8_20_14_0_80_42_17]|nr:MAG: hypothetical protein AUJ18_01350 [Candidatus Hydrogenedentes bacterium CG1_02_42_14]PIU47341.1 MAG: 6-pyruvoyl tetrahydrobiopterin synthase [Candidatus Hydrogenedentes bacterium CG07_land_8_20_14_0_80_42_17]
MWQTIKIIDFSYGHRLLNYEGPCSQPHGHNGRIEIVCESNILNESGMIMDFSKIKSIIKKFVDDNWDHKMLLKREDPLLNYFLEKGEKVFVMDENPTAEILARYLFYFAKKQNLPIVEIRFHETLSSIACYRED